MRRHQPVWIKVCFCRKTAWEAATGQLESFYCTKNGQLTSAMPWTSHTLQPKPSQPQDSSAQVVFAYKHKNRDVIAFALPLPFSLAYEQHNRTSSYCTVSAKALLGTWLWPGWSRRLAAFFGRPTHRGEEPWFEVSSPWRTLHLADPVRRGRLWNTQSSTKLPRLTCPCFPRTSLLLLLYSSTWYVSVGQ